MGFFDANNSDHRSLADAYKNGNHGQISNDQVMSHYQGFLQNTPPEEVQQVHQEYFNQLPQAQRQGLFSGLMGALGGQGGVDPHQAGISTTNPGQASSGDLGNLFNFAMNSGLLGGLLGGGAGNQSGFNGGQQSGSSYGSQNSSGGLQGILSNPLAQAAISGLVGYAANRAINGFTNRGGQSGGQQNSGNFGGGNSGSFNSNPAPSNNQNQNGGSALPGFENKGRTS